jgi:peptidoglycan hydrolase-like protein with peptidoglycan-binding domain
MGDEPTLSVGDVGDWVETLQQRLEAAGYDVGRIDGHFGPRTERALVAFQEACGITEEGVAGPQTWMIFAIGGFVDRVVEQVEETAHRMISGDGRGHREEHEETEWAGRFRTRRSLTSGIPGSWHVRSPV